MSALPIEVGADSAASAVVSMLSQHADLAASHKLGIGWHVRCTCREVFKTLDDSGWMYQPTPEDILQHRAHVAAVLIAAGLRIGERLELVEQAINAERDAIPEGGTLWHRGARAGLAQAADIVHEARS